MTDDTDDNVVPIRPNDKLTGKQLAFVNGVLSGMTQTDAYKAAGYNTSRMTTKTVWEAASRLSGNSKVSARIKAGQVRQEDQATHTGASLRLHVEKGLYELTQKADSDANKLRAYQLLGQGEKCGYFLERSTDIRTDDLEPEEVLEELKERLTKAFNTKAG